MCRSVCWLVGLTLWALLPMPGRAQPAEVFSHGPDEPVVPDDPVADTGSGSDTSAAEGGDFLSAADVDGIVASAASRISGSRMAIAVVDRMGNVLGVFREPGAEEEDGEVALGLARTAAFFSNNMAPLSSRTVRFISGINFPPGIMDTPNAALYGIENTNRGCDLNVVYHDGKAVPAPRSLAGLVDDLACDPFTQWGCGKGPVTGKLDELDSRFEAVNPGGVPIFRLSGGTTPGELLGGIGIAGASAPEAEYTAFRAAFGGSGTAPVPVFPLPPPGNVFIDGVRLPFVEQVERPEGTGSGSGGGSYDPFFLPANGSPVPKGYLAGPLAGGVGGLTVDEVNRIVQQSIDTANRTRAVIRLPLGTCSRMIIAVADLDGALLAIYRMPDATVFSLDVAATKARNVVYFSRDGAGDLRGIPAGTAVTNRTISFGAQPLFPPGISTPAGPFFADIFVPDFVHACSQGTQTANENQSGVVFFPGSVPLYRGGELIGGLGISGDGVEQDDFVAYGGADGFLPPESIWANQVFIDEVRMPFMKFPRNPEACTFP